MFSASLSKTILRLTAVLGLLIFGALSFWGYRRSQAELEGLKDTQEVVDTQERQGIIDAAAQLMVLPEENPLILNIESAAEIAKIQPFFTNAEDGDKLLVFAEAKKSIIYSPARNIIVNVGTLLVEGNTVLPLDTESPLQVEIRQGGASDERITALEERLAGIVEVLLVKEAANQDYQNSVIIALTEDVTRLRQAQIFAANLGLELISDLPENEATSAAEVLLIVGN